MKILYAIQGTGNGHLSRAREIVPILKKYVQTDVLVSGYQSDVEIPFKVNYNLRGLSFIFGKNGGIDVWRTCKNIQVSTLAKELLKIPVQQYKAVINDFEPVTAWACKQKGVQCISLSHQSAVLNPKAPQPKESSIIGKAILKKYAPTNMQLGFHFQAYDNNIFTPIIRSEVRNLQPCKKPFYLVYLPAYSNQKIIEVLTQISSCKWHVYSKHAQMQQFAKNVWLKPINNNQFISDLENCTGLLCGAGFEAPAEALFLQKKLMVVPMKMQFEQACNAAALEKLGVPVLKELSILQVNAIKKWIDEPQKISVAYPDITDSLIQQLLNKVA